MFIFGKATWLQPSTLLYEAVHDSVLDFLLSYETRLTFRFITEV